MRSATSGNYFLANRRFVLFVLFPDRTTRFITRPPCYVSPQIVFVTMPVRSGVQMGDLKTTFTLESSVTRDTEPNNNMVMQEFTVDGRANLTVSM